MKSTLLALSALLIGCDATGTTIPTITATETVSTTDTTTSVTTGTETTDAGSTPDSLPPAQTTPDALIQVAQPDALPVSQDTLPAARDTLPQTTPDTQIPQQPDVQPVKTDTKPSTPDTLVLVDTKPATPDTLALVDTKPATPDVLPVIDTLPATPDTLPATPDTQPAGDTVAACGGDNQACCTTRAVDTNVTRAVFGTDAWIHTCTDSVKGTYDCTIETSVGTVPGPSGTCMMCGYKGYPPCTHLNLGTFSWKWVDANGGTCDHDDDQTPVCTGDVCLCP